jgi:hypothetical protein
MQALSGNADVLRLAGAVTRDPEVAAWLEADASDLRLIARTWFSRMKECGDDVLELLHDGCPVACVGDAPFGYVNVFKHHVNVGFFRGAMLDDPAGLLEGNGKRMRHVKLGPGRETDAGALDKLIAAAYRDIQGCVRRD